MKEIINLVGVLGGYTIVIGSIIYFVSQRIAERLNILWKQDADTKIESLKHSFNKQNDLLNTLMVSYNSNYNQAQGKRIKSIEILWENLLGYKGIIPSDCAFVFNILTEDEIEAFWERETDNLVFIEIRNGLIKLDKNENLNYLGKSKAILKERPFLGEEIWLYYEIYKVFLGRISYLLFKGIENMKFEHWHNDASLRGLFSDNFSKEEFNYIYSHKLRSLDVTINFLEAKLLDEINSTLSGDKASESVLTRIRKFESLLNND